MIDRKSDTPIYRQIYDYIVKNIKEGYYLPNTRIPSRRTLCAKLSVSQQTVETAYQKLVADGYIIPRAGSGYYVFSEDKKQNSDENKLQYNFSANGVEISKMPFDAWLKMLKDTINENTDLFQYGEKQGELSLRKSIRSMLMRTRNISCSADQIIIGPGAEDLLRSLYCLYLKEKVVLMNNYYNFRVRGAAMEVNAEIHYMSGDDDGVNISDLELYDNALLYVNPDHDIPTCVSISDKKRKNLIEWAKDGRYIIEDASGSVFCYGDEKKSLWELSGGKNVIYLGSFSSTIAPSMKIGYIVAPPEVVKLWFERKKQYQNRVSRIDQTALAKFIDNGVYERHVDYMRSVYHEKTIAIKKAVRESELNKIAEIKGDNAGTCMNIHFDIKLDEERAVRLLRNNGIGLYPMTRSMFYKSRGIYKPNTYYVGYGELTITEIREGIRKIAELWKRFI